MQTRNRWLSLKVRPVHLPRPSLTPPDDGPEPQVGLCSVAPHDDVEHVPSPITRPAGAPLRFGPRIVNLAIDGEPPEAEPLRRLPHALSIPPKG